ncbi:MAG: hypothetical protein FWH48_03810 [Oscillospiraceae bacterium]|nr:hypothetical protein [Oscillospiraceae bacterium]
MIKCTNKECDNYNQELEAGTEVCALCKNPVENIETSFDKRKSLGIAISIISVFAILFALLPFLWTFIAGMVIMIACIVTAIVIRIRSAIIVTILAAAGFAAILFYWGFFDLLL